MSKFLEWLGLHVMTNKEALLEELGELDDAAFDHMILSRDSNLQEALEGIMCSDCKTRYGGKCPDCTKCTYELKDWLAEPCKHERLLTVEDKG